MRQTILFKKISKKYRDASHNTFAYTIGLNDDQVKESDNGEPSGTAGVPELKALQLMNLKKRYSRSNPLFWWNQIRSRRFNSCLFQ